jgi:Flp pilus assembly pilin Flp
MRTARRSPASFIAFIEATAPPSDHAEKHRSQPDLQQKPPKALSPKLLERLAPEPDPPMRKVSVETMTLNSVVERIQALVRRAAAEDGQALVEYALLISMIAIVAVGAVEVFGLGVSHLFSKIVAVYP